MLGQMFLPAMNVISGAHRRGTEQILLIDSQIETKYTVLMYLQPKIWLANIIVLSPATANNQQVVLLYWSGKLDNTQSVSADHKCNTSSMYKHTLIIEEEIF